MQRILSLAFAAAMIVAAIGFPADSVVAQSPRSFATFQTGELSIRAGKATHKFLVELAKTAKQQQQGLMFRRQMAPDAGMLFVYRRPLGSAMWMKNTFIPLDMVFIRKGGVIGSIAERTVPMSEAVISSDGPVIAVLELNAGTASRLGIKPGDRVISTALPDAEN